MKKSIFIFLLCLPMCLTAQRAGGLLPERKAPVNVEYRKTLKPVQPIAVLLPRRVYSITTKRVKI